MSKEAVIQLITSAESNPTLLKQLHNVKGTETVLAIGAQRGFQFTETELLAVMQEKQLYFAAEELSEEQLEAVVGGKGKKSNSYSYTTNTYN